MRRTSLALAALAALALTASLAACSSGTGTAAPAVSQSPNAGRFGGGGAAAAAAFPGASGMVAAITGTTAQVQSTSAQTAVSWTSTTTFTDQQPGTSADVAVGDCVIARPATGAAASGSSSIDAATVQVLPSANGACDVQSFGGGFGGNRTGAGAGANGNRGGQGGSTGARPAPSGSPRVNRGQFGAIGTVTSVGDASFVVATQSFGGAPGSNATPSPSTSTPETVTWSSSTTFTKTVPADASAMAVGVCVTARGTKDDTGALTATSIAVSAPVGGACSSGFGARPSAGSGNGSNG